MRCRTTIAGPLAEFIAMVYALRLMYSGALRRLSYAAAKGSGIARAGGATERNCSVPIWQDYFLFWNCIVGILLTRQERF